MIAIVLFVTVCAFFLFLPADQGFTKGHYGYVSSHGASLAKNLSTADNLMLYEKLEKSSRDSKAEYSAYNRFPLTSFSIVKLAMMASDGTPQSELRAARLVMRLFLVAAMIVFWIACNRLTTNPLMSLAAVFFSFSSWYVAYYGDMIFNDTPSLFGFALVFHGMVVQQTDRRSRQLFLKVIVGVSLGWQVLALLAGYVLIATPLRLKDHRGGMAQALRSPPIKALALAGFVAAAWLGGSLLNEHVTMDQGLAELSTVDAIKRRTGQDEGFNRKWSRVTNWSTFLQQQARRIARLCLPYMTASSDAVEDTLDHPSKPMALLGLITLVIAILAAGTSASHPGTWLSLIAGGLVWAIGMRHFVAFHNFQSPFFIGVPLVLATSVFRAVSKRLTWAAWPLVVLMAGFFFTASLIANSYKQENTASAQVLLTDFGAIRRSIGEDKLIYIDGSYEDMGGARHGLDFFLAGNFFTPNRTSADYVISDLRKPGRVSLTPNNKVIHVYDSGSALRRTDLASPRGSCSEARQSFEQPGYASSRNARTSILVD